MINRMEDDESRIIHHVNPVNPVATHQPTSLFSPIRV